MLAFTMLLATAAAAAAQPSTIGTVLVTGAGGRTGRQVYGKLKAQGIDSTPL